MILIPGLTKCPLCHRLIYAIDDRFVVKDLKGTPDIEDFLSGIYHYDCFCRVPFQEEYLRVHERHVHRGLMVDARDWRILRHNDGFVLLWKPLVKEYQLLFLKQGREFTFAGLRYLHEFRALLDDQIRAQGNGDPQLHSKVERTNGGWTLLLQTPVAVSFSFAVEDFGKLASTLGLGDAQGKNQVVDLAEACRKLNVVPQESGCPVERAVGVFRCTAQAPSAETVEIRLVIPTWNQVSLPAGEFDRLREFLDAAQEQIPAPEP